MRLCGIFSDGAVFQRELPIPVWGYAAAGEMVSCELAGNISVAKAQINGAFETYLPAMPAGGPWQLTISCKGEQIVLKDIYIGDVWLASGQSNMEYALGSRWAEQKPDAPNPDLQKVSEEQLRDFQQQLPAHQPFRAFMVEKATSVLPIDDISGKWEEIMAENAASVSAVAAWFGLEINHRLDIPIGLIVSAWGGTIVEAWTSRNALGANENTRSIAEKLKRIFGKTDAWDSQAERIQRLCKPDRGNQGILDDWAGLEFDDSAWREMQIPGSWISRGMAGNGAFWIRRRMKLPADWVGKDLVLHLGGIDKQDIAYFNGAEIGRTGSGFDLQYWDKPRRYRISGNLVKGTDCVIAVRAFSFFLDGGFVGVAPEYKLSLADGTGEIELAGKWKCKSEYDLGYINDRSAYCESAFGVWNPNTPSLIYNGMIHPIRRYGMKGVIWYQGESNANTLNSEYGNHLSCLINDWRYQWEQGDFPFIVVQLAGFGKSAFHDGDSTWASIRQQQEKVCDTLKNVFLSSAIDLGEATDIHPQNKMDVGKRLALCALENVYNVAGVSGNNPAIEKWRKEEDRIILTFKNAGSRLALDEKNIAAFQLAGKDSAFFPADEVEVLGESIVLKSSKVQEPVAACYGWSDNPPCALRGANDLPALPFNVL